MHLIKLLFAKARWKKKRGKELKEFSARTHLFDELKEAEKELEEEYNQLARSQPNANVAANTPIAQLHTIKGKLDEVKELLYG